MFRCRTGNTDSQGADLRIVVADAVGLIVACAEANTRKVTMGGVDGQNPPPHSVTAMCVTMAAAGWIEPFFVSASLFCAGYPLQRKSKLMA